MAYRLEREEELGDGVRRVARELVDEALALLADPSQRGVEKSVHEARKRAKELRGLARMVRPALGKEYRRVNATVRDAGRVLSPIRDAHALLATFDALVAARPSGLPAGGLLGVRAALAARAEEATTGLTADDERLAEAATLFAEVRDGIDGWDVPADVAPLAEGLGRIYGRGRDAMARSREAPTAEHLHEWRKRVKDGWYHVQLLERSAPSVLAPLADRFHDLSDALGDDHDLAVLTELLQGDAEAMGGEEEVAAAVAMAQAAQGDLEERALRLGARLYAEPPEAFVRRLLAYREAWLDVGDELPTGELSDLAPPVDRLDERTSAELADLARERQLPGRSRLSKDALVATLRAAGG